MVWDWFRGSAQRRGLLKRAANREGTAGREKLSAATMEVASLEEWQAAPKP